MTDIKNDSFVDAYNNFDSRPLNGQLLKKFYLDQILEESTKSIVKTITITDRFRKILIIGHTGCGKSTILNKIAEELDSKYHIVSFSVANELNMMDLDTIDILLMIYMQLILSMEESNLKRQENWSGRILKQCNKFMDYIKNDLKIKETEAGVNLLKSISFKIKVEPESRNAIRKAFKCQIDTIQRNIRDTCEEIAEQTEKDVIVIIDDLDKLSDQFAEKIFFKESHILTMPEAKIIFTFPLAAYYLPEFVHISNKFTQNFIRLIQVTDTDGNRVETSFDLLEQLVLKRIDKTLVSKDALVFLIEKSGGLLRDLIKFMQDACKVAIDNETQIADYKTAQIVVRDKINEYERLFDFPKFQNELQKIIKTRNKSEIENNILIYFLRYLFVLEYSKQGEKSWYNAHPCLIDSLYK
jgi:hypothetical protein